MMNAKSLIALLVLLAGVSQLMAADQSQSKSASNHGRAKQRRAEARTRPKKILRPRRMRAKDTAEKPEIHEFVIANFKTESGVTLPQARVVYGTYGHLNAAKDNVVLLPSHYMADCHGYEWLIGPDRALDTSKLFLVATELFGNGHSSSPSNTPEPFHGPRFPVTTIRDNVEAVHRLLTEELKIKHLRAIVGFSMGAQQAFQWAVSYPDFADKIVATAGTAKTYPHGVVRLEGQIAALTADAAFQNGDYTAPPKKGLEAFATVWTAWLFSQEWWRKELWKASSPPGTTFEQTLHEFRTNFIPGADANNLILQCRTWEKHDVGATPGFNGDVEKALRSIKTPFLVYAVGNRSLFPCRRCALRSGIYEHGDAYADSFLVGAYGWRGAESGGLEVFE